MCKVGKKSSDKICFNLFYTLQLNYFSHICGKLHIKTLNLNNSHVYWFYKEITKDLYTIYRIDIFYFFIPTHRSGDIWINEFSRWLLTHAPEIQNLIYKRIVTWKKNATVVSEGKKILPTGVLSSFRNPLTTFFKNDRQLIA